MVQLAKCLLHKFEDLNLDPSTHIKKKLGTKEHACDPRTGEVETELPCSSISELRN